MNTQQTIKVIVLLAILSFGMFNVIRNPLIQKEIAIQNNSIHSAALDPIIIQDDSDFEDQGWPGNGTAINPYTIKDLEISGNSTFPAISIGHTYSYFVIENCELLDGGYFYVVTMSDTFNGEIKDCIIADSTGTDIYLFGCNSINITRSSPDTGTLAISMAYSTMCNVLYNTDVGVGLVNSTDCTIQHNQFGSGEFQILGPEAQYWIHNVENNTDTNGKMSYFANLSSQTIDLSQYSSLYVGFCNDVTFENGAFSSGVRIAYSTNCILRNSEFLGELTVLSITYSNFTSVDNCMFNPESGFISVYGSSYTLISNCYISLSYIRGILIRFFDTYANSLLNNTMIVTVTGEETQDTIVIHGDDSIVSGNDIRGTGFWLRGSNSRISDNTFQCPTTVQDSNNTIIRNNIFTNVSWNSGPALQVVWSDSVTIVNNTITYNADYGVLLHGCSNCLIYRNQIGWNSFQNAYDSSGENNIWDDGISIGNTWSDYSGQGEYEIEGSSGSVDRYPSRLIDPQEGELGIIVIVIIACGTVVAIAVVGAILLKKRRI